MLKKYITITVSTLLLAACGSGSQMNNSKSEQQEAIFSETTDQESQNAIQALGETDEISTTTVKARQVKVNFGALKKLAGGVAIGETRKVFKQLDLNLFEGEVKTVLLDQIQKIADDNFIFTGQILGDLDSGVTLVINKGVLIANIRSSDRDEAYEVRYTAHGIHTVALKKDEEETDCPSVEAPGETAHTENVENEFDGDISSQGTSVVRILTAYTPNARIAAGGTTAMEALIQMGIADTNVALANSGTTMQVELAGTMELAKNETGNWSTDLNYLKGKTDGLWDEVHARRSALQADQVNVVATYPKQVGTNGIGYVNSTFASAFSILRRTAFGAYTYAHELGHNWGLNHSDGYQNMAGRFRTIMIYGSQPRIRRFSNPNLPYNGNITGTDTHFSAKIINRRANVMSNLI